MTKPETPADAYHVTVMEDSSPEFTFENWDASCPAFLFVCDERLTKETEMPTAAIRGDSRPLNDVFWVHANGNAVSERFKRIIEEEPGVHWFFPLQLKNADGSLIEEPYYMFAVRQKSVCVLPHLSDCNPVRRVKYGPNAGQPYQTCYDRGLVLSGPAIGDRKVFSTVLIDPGKMIVSKEIGARLIAEGITGLRMDPAQVINEAWDLEKHAPDFAEWYRDHPEQMVGIFD